jgi:hypothetical protein
VLTYQNSHRGGGGLPPRRVVSMHTLGRIMCLQWGHLADVWLHMNLRRFCRWSTVAMLTPQGNGWSAAPMGSATGASAAEAGSGLASSPDPVFAAIAAFVTLKRGLSIPSNPPADSGFVEISATL